MKEFLSELKRPRYLVILGGVVALVVALIIGLVSPVSALSNVQIEGNESVSVETVKEAAGLEEGTPMMQIDEKLIASRVQDIPKIASVSVVKSWPNTVVIKVVERFNVAKVQQGDKWGIIDSAGEVYRVTSKEPKLTLVEAQGDAIGVSAKVIAGLPKWLSKRLMTVSAKDAESVILHLEDGDNVSWGNADQGELKAQVLRLLLKGSGIYWFDVRNPNAPTTAHASPQPVKPKPKKKEDDQEQLSDTGEDSTEEVPGTAPQSVAPTASTSPSPSGSMSPNTPYLLP